METQNQIKFQPLTEKELELLIDKELDGTLRLFLVLSKSRSFYAHIFLFSVTEFNLTVAGRGMQIE